MTGDGSGNPRDRSVAALPVGEVFPEDLPNGIKCCATGCAERSTHVVSWTQDMSATWRWEGGAIRQQRRWCSWHAGEYAERHGLTIGAAA